MSLTYYILTTTISPPPTPPSPSSYHPSPPDPLLQQRAGLGASIKHSIAGYDKTRHMPSYQAGWGKPVREKRSQKQR